MNCWVNLLIFLGYISLSSSQQRQEDSQKICHDADVLILGAGMAGIAAGYTLSNEQNGTSNFIILEAGDRIGGRVKSQILQNSGARVELGANWIQGIDPQQPEKHPLYRIARGCGGLQGFYMGRELNTSYHFYNSSGAEITNSKELKQRFKDWYTAEEEISDESTRRTKAGLDDISVRRALEDNGWIPKSPIDSVIEWAGIDFNLGYTPENSSLLLDYPDPAYTDFGDPSRTADYFVTDQKVGFVGVVQCLADRYLTSGDSRLHLQSVVKEIEWSDQCVCATTAESESLRRYCAPYAIVTFSVGVLKSKIVKFTPELPQIKQNAFDHAYDALFLKIFLEFDETFWPIDANYILHADEERGHFCIFQSLPQHFPGQPSILLATVTGRWAAAVYDQTSNATQSQIMQVLQKLYGSQIPDPVSITIPDWGVNPHFMGMYSDFPPGYGHLRDDLVSPAGRLYFGGEATSSDYNGYLHGAYFSGIDVANQIIGMMK